MPNLIVVPPGGVVERRDQVIKGLPNVVPESVQIDDVVVADHGATAVVVARVTAKRTPGRCRWVGAEPYDERLRERSGAVATAREIDYPCVERAIEAGRC